VMMDDNLFANFIDDDSRFLVMEDADAFLQARADGNTIMHKFLNVSDGLISAADKKLVFSTNIPNIRDIDAALIRPGRCFDVMEFRALSIDEAQAVIRESGAGKLPAHKMQATLAEIFSSQPSGGAKKRTGVGFAP
jgi:ATP-dependent 26S proteasome regulatory subunit